MALKFILIAAFNLTCFANLALAGDCEIKIYAKFKSEFSDPIKAINWWDKKYVSLVYDTLIKFDENGNLSPGLASKWKVDKKTNTLTISLKKGTAFHDGTEIVAGHIVKVLERIKVETNPDKTKMSKVLSIRALNDHTLELKYDSLSSYDVYLLATPRFSIYKPGYPRIGTGPWIFNRKEKNKLFFTSFQSSQYAQCRTLSSTDVPFDQAINLFKSGDLDIIEYVSLSKKELDWVKKEILGRGQLHAFKTFDTTILFYSRQGKTPDSSRLKFLHNLYLNPALTEDSNDQLAFNIIPPGVNALLEKSVRMDRKQDSWEHVPGQTVYVPNTTEYKGALIQNIVKLFKKHKNVLNVQVVSLEELYKLHAKGKVTFHIETVTLQAPHPYGILSMFHSKSGENFTGFNDTLVDQLLINGLEKEGEVSTVHFKDASEKIIQSGFAVPLVHQIKNVIISNKIAGYNFSKISTYHEYYSTLSKKGQGQ